MTEQEMLAVWKKFDPNRTLATHALYVVRQTIDLANEKLVMNPKRELTNDDLDTIYALRDAARDVMKLINPESENEDYL